MTGYPEAIPGQKSRCGKSHQTGNEKRAYRQLNRVVPQSSANQKLSRNGVRGTHHAIVVAHGRFTRSRETAPTHPRFYL